MSKPRFSAELQIWALEHDSQACRDFCAARDLYIAHPDNGSLAILEATAPEIEREMQAAKLREVSK